MQITSKDLRIGNYVSIQNETVKVESIDDTGINLNVDYHLSEIDYGAMFNNSYPYLKPILITEEWLVKFGFVKEINQDDNFTNIKFTIGKVSMRKEIWKGYTDDLFNFTLYFGDDCLISLQFLHQLQNLYYFLTGEEFLIQ